MRFFSRVIPVLLAALAGAAVVAGCGRQPLAPLPAASGAYVNPTFARVDDTKSGSLAMSSTGPVTGSGDVDGDTGGEVCVGRFRVIVPAGAFEGLATITVTVPDPDVVSCELGISPPEANGFAVPVTLVADCQGVTNVDLANCGTLWFDESAGVWRTVAGTAVDLGDHKVSAQLPHFSIYGICDLLEGRAGW